MNDNHDKEAQSGKNFIKVFGKCPGCGSTERYFEGILNELKDRGLLDKRIECFDFQLQQGIGVPPQKVALLPFGSEIPAFRRIWDTCCNCGMVYSTVLERVAAKKSLEVAGPATQQPPNRADRRRMEQRGGMPFQNNPRLS